MLSTTVHHLVPVFEWLNIINILSWNAAGAYTTFKCTAVLHDKKLNVRSGSKFISFKGPLNKSGVDQLSKWSSKNNMPNTGFRLPCRSPLCRYAAWSSLAVSELQLSATTPLWLYHRAASQYICLNIVGWGKQRNT